MYYRGGRIWQRPIREYLPILIALVVLVVGSFFALSYYVYFNCHVWQDTVVPATCSTPGYTTHVCTICGESRTDTYTTAGHVYSEYRTIRAADEDTVGIMASYCGDCGNCVLSTVRPTLEMPKVYMDGNFASMTSDNAVTLSLTYDSYDVHFTTTALVRWQGFTAATLPKKNYNVKFYTDDTLTVHQREDLGFGNWGAQWKYTFKANFIDCSHSRNIVTSRLWGAMVRTRPYVREELVASPNGGAVDGFPIRVYQNGEFAGVYTLNIPKDKWMLGMDETTHPFSAIITSQMHSKTNLFQATTDLYTTSDWDVEYCSTDTDIGWLNESFNNMLRFVSTKSGDEFREGIHEYIDVDAVIDYAIMCYTMYGRDNWVKNMVLVTYDGTRWIPCIYDADATFGLYWDGTHFYDFATEIDAGMPPTTLTESNANSKSNRLISKVLYHFFDDFTARYWELRDGILSNENIIAEFDRFMSGIPMEYYELDQSINGMPNPTCTYSYAKNDVDQIAYYVERHMANLDAAMLRIRR